MTTAEALYLRLIEMMTDGKHGDALSVKDAQDLIKNRNLFTDQELSEMIGEKAVEPFKLFCDKLGL